MLQSILENWQSYLFILISIFAAIILGLFLQACLLALIKSIAQKANSQLGEILSKYLRWPLRFLLPLIFISFTIPILNLDPEIILQIKPFLTSFFIILISWLIIKSISATIEFTNDKLSHALQDNFKFRKIFTQLQIIKRIITILIILIALAIILLQFEQISNIGTTILASAGVISIILGFAAQRSISTLFAGFQIAFSQPIRLDDVVVVEGEWGIIEEITLTYVVVRIWDLRRLILPITYFIEKPFQNWTRKSSEIVGTVSIYTDYAIPVEAIRQKLLDLLNTNSNWDQKIAKLEVVDCTDKVIELRALVSASDASKLWKLRCQIREDLIKYIANNYPQYLPKIRSLQEKN